MWNSDRAHDISHLPPLKIDPDAIWFRRLKSGCLIAVDDLSDPDMEIVAGNWRKELHDGGLKSICVAGIWVCLLIKRPTACGMACIVPCVILINDMVGVERYYYAAARVSETVVGVTVAFLINSLLPTRNPQPQDK